MVKFISIYFLKVVRNMLYVYNRLRRVIVVIVTFVGVLLLVLLLYFGTSLFCLVNRENFDNYYLINDFLLLFNKSFLYYYMCGFFFL